jgi:RimJ/RimL family protein N-acetyltransferase
MIIAPRVLEGRHIRLEPLGEVHREAMRETLDRDPDGWALLSISGMGEHFDAYWQLMTQTPRRITLAAFDKASGIMAGTSSLFEIDPKHRTLEIGHTWFRPECRGTALNPEAKLLMLSEAFGAGARRVQFSVSAANLRSQAALEKLGAKREALLRKHRITWTGASRDTVLFSILDDEWPAVKVGLERRLGAG